MLRLSIVLAFVACIVGVAAPDFIPTLLQSMAGTAAPPPPPAPAPRAPAPAPIAQVSAAEDSDGRVVELYPDGMGQYSTDVRVNGTTLHMMVDTGASFVSLSYESAARLGLSLSESNFTLGMRTANGIARAAPVMLTGVSIGDVYLPTVEGVVMERGANAPNLLGMSFLKRLSAVEQKGGRLVLRQ